VVLQGEVARVEQVERGVRQVTQVRPGAGLGEEGVARAPGDERRRAVFTQVRLPVRVGGEVAAVVVGQRELGLLAARLAQEELVEQPPLRRDQLGIGGAALVLGAGRVEGEQVRAKRVNPMRSTKPSTTSARRSNE
jgi:hypothetical protein